MRLPNRDTYRNVIFFAVAVSVALIALCVTDLVASYPLQPFMGQTAFDVAFLISSAILLYMCWHTWHDLDLGDQPPRQLNVSESTQYGTFSGRTSERPRATSAGARRGNRSGSGHRATVS